MTLRVAIEQYLQANTTAFKEIAGSASFEAALSGRLETPGCYVFPERDQAGPNKLVNIVSQSVTETIGLIIVTRNVRGDRFADASDENQNCRDIVRDTLLGKELEGYSMLEYAGGVLVSLKNSVLIWHVAYRATKEIRSLL